MAKLIYLMLASLDGYTADAEGGFGWAVPDEARHSWVNELASSIGIHLYGSTRGCSRRDRSETAWSPSGVHRYRPGGRRR